MANANKTFEDAIRRELQRRQQPEPTVTEDPSRLGLAPEPSLIISGMQEAVAPEFDPTVKIPFEEIVRQQVSIEKSKERKLPAAERLMLFLRGVEIKGAQFLGFRRMQSTPAEELEERAIKIVRRLGPLLIQNVCSNPQTLHVCVIYNL